MPRGAPTTYGAVQVDRRRRGPGARAARLTWEPGMVVVHRSGYTAVLYIRKLEGDGWWLVGGDGLDDSVSPDDWVALTPAVVAQLFAKAS